MQLPGLPLIGETKKRERDKDRSRYDRSSSGPRGDQTAGGPNRGDRAGPRGQGRTAGAGHLIVAAVASWAMPLRSFSLLDSVLACAKLRYNARLVSDVGVFNPRPKDCGSLLP